MFVHYLKIAWRNLLKYRTQTAVNIVGLAVGFACFAFANLWMHYETTYDTFRPGAERMYLLYRESMMNNSGVMANAPYPVSTLLKAEFPEVEEACAFTRLPVDELTMKEDAPEVQMPCMQLDSCGMRMFGIQVLAGNTDFLYFNERIALTESTARRFFGTTAEAVGQTVYYRDEPHTVCAVVSDMPHSNFSFGFIAEGAYFRKWQDNWWNGGFQVVIKLREGVSAEVFHKKMQAYGEKFDPNDNRAIVKRLKLMPVTGYRYASFNPECEVRFSYLVLFAVAGGLVILCSLFNHLALFISRINIRRRELGLRKVCGSSGRGLFAMLTVEYALLILLSGLVGMTLVEALRSPFNALSGVEGDIYGQSLLYFVAVLVLSLFLLIPFVWRFASLRPERSGAKAFPRSMVIVQLFISFVSIFCMAVLMKQLNYLKTTDLGWERKDLAAFTFIYPDEAKDEILDKVRQMSCTREVLSGYYGIMPEGARSSTRLDWEDRPKEYTLDGIKTMCMDETLAHFYNIRTTEGEMLKEHDRGKAMLNESAVRAMGVTNPIGLKVTTGRGATLTIVGIVHDFHISPPTIPVTPTLFVCKGELGWGEGSHVLVKYHAGQWRNLRAGVDSLFAHNYSHVDYRLVNVMDEYNAYLKAENLLLHLLGFVSLVCIVVSTFGIFSMVTLSCERRRKEIAIRKVNGARVGDILRLFAREYLGLLLVASVVAFPVGYVLMRHWLESYVEQTPISAWIYIVIFAGMAVLIALCIGWRVWRAANENPAEVVKSE